MLLFAKSDVGAVREENQDSFSHFTVEETAFLMVCDGLGGHLGGKRASELACQVIEEKIKAEYKKTFSQGKIEELLRECVASANAVIWDHSKKEIENRGMGTTIVLSAVRSGKYTLLNLGDSRAYLIGENKIEQITKDQSYVQSLIDKGELTPKQARNHPQKSIIMQAAGLGGSVCPDVYKGDVELGLLLCSDGLTNELEDSEILDIIKKCEMPDAAEKLVLAANASGGRDNITVVIGFNINQTDEGEE